MPSETVTTYGPGGYDPSKPNNNVVEERTVEVPPDGANSKALDERMDAALTGLRTYIANTSPTAAQTTAVVKLLCRVTIAMIRHRFSRYEDVD